MTSCIFALVKLVATYGPPSAGRSSASRLSSHNHVSFSERSSASRAPVPAALHPDIAEIQPARIVSENSDSQGATFFQPIEFRDHMTCMSRYVESCD